MSFIFGLITLIPSTHHFSYSRFSWTKEEGLHRHFCAAELRAAQIILLEINCKSCTIQSVASLFLLYLAFSFPHGAKQRGAAWNGKSELLTVTGWVSFCLGSPVRPGPLQTDKRDPWRAWHFHLARASSRWAAHSFQLTPALCVVSGAWDWEGGREGGSLLEAGWICSAFYGYEVAHAGLRSQWGKGTDGSVGCTQTEQWRVRLMSGHTNAQAETNAEFPFFFAAEKLDSSWEGIRMTCRTDNVIMRVRLHLPVFVCLCVCLHWWPLLSTGVGVLLRLGSPCCSSNITRAIDVV